MMKIIARVFWSLLFVAVLLGGYAFVRGKQSIRHEAVTAVKKGDVTQTVFAMADVVSAGSVDLSFKIDGKVVFMGVRVGEKVRRGQKIVEIDTGTLEQQIRQAKENIAFQMSTLDNMKLYKNKDIFTKAQKEAQNANINSARSALSALETQLDETILYAPADGLVTKKNFSVGEVVSAGSVVVSIAGENDLEVRARVPEAAINKVSVGQMALATFDALPNEKIELRVLEIEPDATVIQGNHYYLVKLPGRRHRATERRCRSCRCRTGSMAAAPHRAGPGFGTRQLGELVLARPHRLPRWAARERTVGRSWPSEVGGIVSRRFLLRIQ
jgi:multidrug resistance efflux pump